MTARLILRALWRQKLVALLLLALTLVSTALYLRSVPRIYTATASVAIVPGPVTQGFGELSGPVLGTLEDLARSTDVIEQALEPVRDAPPAQAVRAATTTQAVKDTFTLRISVALEDPALAAELANRIASTLPSFNLVPERVSYRAVEVARPPEAPSSPQEGLVLAVGTLLGLALAVAGALLVDDARRRIEDAEELAEVTQAPLLGEVTRPRKRRRLLTAADEGARDELRSLRVGLSSAAPTGPLVVAGLGVRDDDRWLSTNTAVGLAGVHGRVVLVLASPTAEGPAVTTLPARGEHAASAADEAAAPAPGLSEALRGRELSAVLQTGVVPGLHVLGPGQDPDALPALLEARFETLLAKLAAEFDVVVVDAPPLSASDDARVLAAGGRLLVWNHVGSTSQRAAAGLMRELGVVRAQVVGCVAVHGVRRLPFRRHGRRRR